MNCRTFSKSLKDYIAGELSEDVNEAMEKHISRCEKCNMLYESEYGSYKAIKGMALPQNIDFTSSRYEILQSIDKERYNMSFSKKLSFYFRRNSIKYALGAVAIIAVIALSSLAINQFKNINMMGKSNTQDVPKAGSSVENVSPADSTPKDVPAANTNTKDVPATNSNSKDVPANKSNTKDTSQPSKTQENKSNNQVKQNNVYNNDKLGISFTVPQSWIGRYTVKEETYGVNVFFKPTVPAPEGSGLIFCLIKEGYGDEEFLDSMGDPKTIVAKGVTYHIDGPRDIGFPDDHKEYKDYQKFRQDVPSVVKTIKTVK
jgi:hypothetical protein